MVRIGGSHPPDTGSIPVPATMAPSNKWLVRQPFKLKMMGSIPSGVAVAVAQLAEQWVVIPPVAGSIPAGHLWQRRASGLSRYAANVLFVGSNPTVVFKPKYS